MLGEEVKEGEQGEEGEHRRVRFMDLRVGRLTALVGIVEVEVEVGMEADMGGVRVWAGLGELGEV